MRFLFFLVCFITISTAKSQHQQLCFKSSDSAYMDKPIQLAFTIIDKQWSSAFVQYKDQEGGLLLKFVEEKVIEEISGRPWQIEYTFNELLNGKVNGKYVISLQGPKVISFYYFNKQKEKISFEQDYNISQHCGCEW